MSANSRAALALLLLGGCDKLSSDGRSAQAGEARVRFGAGQNVEEDAEAPKGVGEPMAWRRRDEAGGPIALYGSDSNDPAFAIRCDRARRTIALSRAGTGGNISLDINGSTASYNGRAITAGSDRVEAQLPMADPVLDRLGARGAVFTIQTGHGPVEIHSGVAIRRVVEACRTPPAPVVVPTPEEVADEAAPVAPLAPPPVFETR